MNFAAHRKHYFYDENSNRTVVITSLTNTGQYRAVVDESDTDERDYIAFGYGHSRLAAIADLNDSIAMSRQQAEEEAA